VDELIRFALGAFIALALMGALAALISRILDKEKR
jgi:hypothetical protein